MENRYLAHLNLPDDHEEATWGVIRRFWWNPSIKETEEGVLLYFGETVEATFDTMAELRAFVSGMATVHMALPAEAVATMEQVMGVEPDWDDRPDWWQERGLP